MSILSYISLYNKWKDTTLNIPIRPDIPNSINFKEMTKYLSLLEVYVNEIKNYTEYLKYCEIFTDEKKQNIIKCIKIEETIKSLKTLKPILELYNSYHNEVRISTYNISQMKVKECIDGLKTVDVYDESGGLSTTFLYTKDEKVRVDKIYLDIIISDDEYLSNYSTIEILKDTIILSNNETKYKITPKIIFSL